MPGVSGQVHCGGDGLTYKNDPAYKWLRRLLIVCFVVMTAIVVETIALMWQMA